MQKLRKDSKVFRSESDATRIQHTFAENFNLDNFAIYFDFIKYYIDLEKSTPKIHTWCKG